MNTRNNSQIAFAFASVAAAFAVMWPTSISLGDQVQLVDASAWGGFFNGGPFEVKSLGFTPDGLNQYGAGPDTFISFAIELNDQAWEGPFNYEAGISTDAIGNGAGGGYSDAIDDRTAFLYTSFIDGSLAGVGSGGFIYGDTDSGRSLQRAMLYIEEEINYGALDALGQSLVALADNALTGVWSGKGIGNVRALNISDSGGWLYQDMLVLLPAQIPLPTPIALAAAGLLGTGLMMRRRHGKSG